LTKKNFSYIALDGEKPVGFVVTIPDINQAFKHVKRGRLLPFGFINLLTHLNKIDNFRVILFGIIDEYRKRVIDIVFYTKIITNCARKEKCFKERLVEY